MLKELIVVEGRDDTAAVKAAIECETLETHGYAYGKKTIEILKEASKKRGVIILTDPDYIGKKIRKDISSKVPNCKHAYLPKGKALKKGDIGVENAKPEDIIEAIMNAKPEVKAKKIIYKNSDLVKYGLSGGKESAILREKLARELHIEYGNSKSLLEKLNSLEIEKEELEKLLEKIK